MKRRRMNFPAPFETTKRDRRGVQMNHDGEPTTVQLKRWTPDRSMRATIDNSCCKCGLRHLLVFEVFQDASGRFYLNKRAWGIR